MKALSLLILVAAFTGVQAAPPELWPAAVKAPQPAELKKQSAALAAATVPAELKPAAAFQQTFLKIITSRFSKAQPLEPDWVAELRRFVAADRKADPIAHGIAEIARVWLARVQMVQIDTALHQYYRANVRFPEQFSAIESGLPESLRRDPWGEPWIYQPRAPQGFAKLSTQRYRLSPTSHPDLTMFDEATENRNPAAPDWKITFRTLGEKRLLEFRTPGATDTVEPGGKIGPRTLLYIGEHWALLAGPDQLFTVTFP